MDAGRDGQYRAGRTLFELGDSYRLCLSDQELANLSEVSKWVLFETGHDVARAVSVP